MSREDFQKLKGGVVKRRTRRVVGLFIDGTGLDRATRRLERKVDLSRLVSGLCAGISPAIARYYTLVPHEDDARQFAFLDAVERAGLEVVIKRLPPKGVKRQVSMDVHIAADLVSYASGYFDSKDEENTDEEEAPRVLKLGKAAEDGASEANGSNGSSRGKAAAKVRHVAVVVCPTREMSYAIYMCHLQGVETHLADFGLYGASDGWKGVDRWIDLSTSETIWRD
ncbi:MAG: NYN domain-containing protein [Bdellovibrionales bacterium]|nr:NYN domain-containing protein [Bdellovibrionales bacterium]